MTPQPAEAGPSNHHPLSPTSRPAFAQRSSLFTTPTSGSSSAQQGYFDLVTADHALPRQQQRPRKSPSPRRRKLSGASDSELLGVAPPHRTGQNARKPSPAPSHHHTTGNAEEEDDAGSTFRPSAARRADSTSSKPWSVYLDSLSREEMSVVATRFDLMLPEALEEYLGRWNQRSDTTPLGTGLLTPRVLPGNSNSFPTSPTTPKAVRDTRDNLSLRTIERSDADQSPLFPPSPPSHVAKRGNMNHPLRILSRAVEELKEAVQRLEEENDLLRAVESPVTGQKSADRVSSFDLLVADCRLPYMMT